MPPRDASPLLQRPLSGRTGRNEKGYAIQSDRSLCPRSKISGSGTPPLPLSQLRAGLSRLDGPIPPGTPIGRLSDTEWGWIVAGVLFGWISKRAEQAAAEQLDTERTIRMTALDPQPWDAGAVAAILPDLADACSGLDWSKPLTAWPKDDIIEFLLKAMPLIRKAMIARDFSEQGRHPKIQREHDRAPDQRRCWRAVDDAGRAQRRDWLVAKRGVPPDAESESRQPIA